MKYPEVSFRVIGNSGPLSIYFKDGPYGNAIESADGNGVYWVSQDNTLLGIEFDDVLTKEDHQTMTVPDGKKIEVFVKAGQVKIKFPAAKTNKKKVA